MAKNKWCIKSDTTSTKLRSTVKFGQKNLSKKSYPAARKFTAVKHQRPYRIKKCGLNQTSKNTSVVVESLSEPVGASVTQEEEDPINVVDDDVTLTGHDVIATGFCGFPDRMSGQFDAERSEVCGICKKTLRIYTKAGLLHMAKVRDHALSHISGSYWKCTGCQRTNRRKVKIAAHIRADHHEESGFCAELNGISEIQYENLVDSTVIRCFPTIETPRKPDNGLIKIDIHDVPGERREVCALCGKDVVVFKLRSGGRKVQLHLGSMKGHAACHMTEMVWACGRCGKRAKRREDIQQHANLAHKNQFTSQPRLMLSEQEYDCTMKDLLRQCFPYLHQIQEDYEVEDCD